MAVCLVFSFRFDSHFLYGRGAGIIRQRARYVSDEATGEPIRTASVTINPGGKKTVTGSDGRFEYTTLEAGQYTLQIAKDGYQTNVGNVTVVPGQTAQCDILLRPGDGY